MNDLEIIENLTQIVARQSGIINKLYITVKQAELITSFDASVEAVQSETERIIKQQEGATNER